MMTFNPIEPDRLDAMRATGHDEFGNAWTHRDAGGGEPLRCCLRRATAGEAIALICYSPWTRRSPWAESGPVFVHFERCAGYPDRTVYPQAFTDAPSMLNPFDHAGERAYDHITFVDPGTEHEKAVRAVMAEPDVAFLHVRSATAGCFTFEVRVDR
jgi:hypothetical protein